MTTHLTTADLRRLKTMLMDLRFIQAAALVASGVNETKQATDYMKEISRMDKLIELELKEKLA
jgi:hypothetical protein